MITTAEIVSITPSEEVTNLSTIIKLPDGTTSTEFKNYYKVKIPIFKSSISTSDSGCIRNAYCANQGGLYSSYNVGDKVFVGFFNNEMNVPIIIGKINPKSVDISNKDNIDSNARSLGILKDLVVSNKAVLPEDTKIGEITYSDLKMVIDYIKNLSLSKAMWEDIEIPNY